MKKTAVLLVLLLLLSALCPAGLAQAAAAAPPEETFRTESLLLVDRTSGEALYSRNADVQRCMASTTKVMTCILVLESVEDLDTAQLTVTKDALGDLAGTGASVIGLEDWDGMSLPVLDVLYGMMLSSGCDAASELAWYVSGGDISAFVDQMNEKAREIGCENTNYADAHGLSDNNRTTAWDLYRVVSYALELPRFQEIVSSTRYTSAAMGKTFYTTVSIQDPQRGGPYYYPYVEGVKTGFTYAAGRCLVSTASKGSTHYLCVALGAPDDSTNHAMEDTVSLYKWAFDTYTDNIDVDISRQYASVQLGDSLSLAASVTRNTTGEAPVFTWTSSDPEIAAVSADGTVSAIAPGIATIQVETQTGNRDTVTVCCGLYYGMTVSADRPLEDWTLPALSGVDFVLVYADDDMVENIQIARGYGIPVGILCSAVGHTDVDAMGAADSITLQISATDIDLPVFYALYDDDFLSRGAEENTAAVQAFRDTLAEKGLEGGCLAPAAVSLDHAVLRAEGVPLWLDRDEAEADFTDLTFPDGVPADFIRYADSFRFPGAAEATMFRRVFAVMASAQPASGSAPTLTADADADAGTVSLSWTAPDWDCYGYRVYRSASGEAPELLAELSAEEMAWQDTTAIPGVSYIYTVASCSVGDILDPGYLRDTLSAEVSASIPAPEVSDPAPEQNPAVPGTPSSPTSPSRTNNGPSRYLWLLLLIPVVVLIVVLIYSKVRPHGRHEMAAVGSARDTMDTEETEESEYEEE